MKLYISETEGISEDDLIDLGFSKHEMMGNSFWNTPKMHYYKKGRITINATEFWTWFLDSEMRNDISVNTKTALEELIKTHE